MCGRSDSAQDSGRLGTVFLARLAGSATNNALLEPRFPGSRAIKTMDLPPAATPRASSCQSDRTPLDEARVVPERLRLPDVEALEAGVGGIQEEVVVFRNDHARHGEDS